MRYGTGKIGIERDLGVCELYVLATKKTTRLLQPMTQDESWFAKYNEVKTFIEKNHRNPSRYDAEERGLYCNWIKHNKKMLKAGELKEDRVERFEKLLALCEEYKRVNQWV